MSALFNQVKWSARILRILTESVEDVMDRIRKTESSIMQHIIKHVGLTRKQMRL